MSTKFIHAAAFAAAIAFIGMNSAHAWEMTGSITATIVGDQPAGGGAAPAEEPAAASETPLPAIVGGGGGAAFQAVPDLGYGLGGYSEAPMPMAQSGTLLSPGVVAAAYPIVPNTGLGPLFSDKNAAGKTRFKRGEAIFTVLLAAAMSLTGVRLIERYYSHRGGMS